MPTRFQRCNTNNNIYFKTKENGLLIIVVYVDDIIFGCNNDKLSHEFADAMASEFEMSMIGELSFFLGLQIYQTLEDIFISQSKYIREMLSIFGMADCALVGTLMPTSCKLIRDDQSPQVDITLFRSIIGILLYLKASRPDIIQAVGMLDRF